MKVIQANFEILTPINEIEVYKRIESIARVCYKSEYRITEDGQSAKDLITKFMNAQPYPHWAMIEHAGLFSVKFICDRGVSHELVRHRLASFAQESTRYCNYSADKFGNELTFIKPCFWNTESVEYKIWEIMMKEIEYHYLELVNKFKIAPEQARSILPNSIKTEIIVSANLTEWKHIFDLRTSAKAHPQMRELMDHVYAYFKLTLPLIFK